MHCRFIYIPLLYGFFGFLPSLEVIAQEKTTDSLTFKISRDTVWIVIHDTLRIVVHSPEAPRIIVTPSEPPILVPVPNAPSNPAPSPKEIEHAEYPKNRSYSEMTPIERVGQFLQGFEIMSEKKDLERTIEKDVMNRYAGSLLSKLEYSRSIQDTLLYEKTLYELKLLTKERQITLLLTTNESQRKSLEIDAFHQNSLRRSFLMILILFTLVIVIILIVYRQKAFRAKSRIDREEEKKNIQKSYTKQLLESMESERQRIANDLHDNISQVLLFICNEADLAVQARDSSTTTSSLSRISDLAKVAVQDVRSTCRNLIPVQLQRVGLTKTIDDMAQRLISHKTIHFSFSLANIDTLFSPEESLNLFRIIQEGITNIIKHSKSTMASVSITSSDQTVDILIEDNGIGIPHNFNEELSYINIGLGLFGMYQRIEFLGGTLNIDSPHGQGTRIRIRIPFS